MTHNRRRMVTFGIGATAGAAVCALVTTGLLGSGLGFLGSAARLATVPSAAAGELPAFGDCEQLRRWYVDQAISQVGPWGFGGMAVPMIAKQSDTDLGSAFAAREDAGDTGAVGSSGTGTNTQEADVDEADIAKTDGGIVVRVSGPQLVVTDVSSAAPREVSRTPLPGPALDRPELLLRDHRVVVVGDELVRTYYQRQEKYSEPMVPPFSPHETRAHVISLDLTDPAAPQVTGNQVVDGGAVSTREYCDGTVRAWSRPASRSSTSSPRPRPLPTGGDPGEPRHGPRGDGRPTGCPACAATVADRSRCSTAATCGTRSGRGFGTLSVLTFPFDDAARSSHRRHGRRRPGVLLGGPALRRHAWTRLVATRPALPSRWRGRRRRHAGLPRLQTKTQVHAFDLTTVPRRTSRRAACRARPRPLVVQRARGHGSGSRRRWDAADGQTENAVTSSRRTATGSATGRPSTAWVTGEHDPVGALVRATSRSWSRSGRPTRSTPSTWPTRPHPRVVGELKIRGYSSYLHPVGDDLLLGVGHDATRRA